MFRTLKILPMCVLLAFGLLGACGPSPMQTSFSDSQQIGATKLKKILKVRKQNRSFLRKLGPEELSLYQEGTQASYDLARIKVFPTGKSQLSKISFASPQGLTVARYSLTKRAMVGEARVADGLVVDPATSVFLKGLARDEALLIRPVGAITAVKLAKRKFSFRGYFLLHKTLRKRGYKKSNEANWHWSVINYVPLSDYLNSVVSQEIGGSAPTEALKAQAVAARSYSLSQMFRARQDYLTFWDMDRTVNFQAYMGTSVEHDRVTQAVADTAQLVMFYARTADGVEEVVEALYHANSGASTRSHRRLQDHPYLVSAENPQGWDQFPVAGHRFGMSQVGAMLLAQPPHNKSFEEILKHYYYDVQVKKIQGE